jgi:ferredoxin-NADP reductase
MEGGQHWGREAGKTRRYSLCGLEKWRNLVISVTADAMRGRWELTRWMHSKMDGGGRR